MDNEKRVMCLYRVSTLGQVDKDDIPMQRECCRAFVDTHPGWRIVNELYEKGISGFKTAAKDRDAIVQLQHAAIKKEFDILLVYMFDRMGRRDDETPFVVEWFANNGIEVWSTVEGQQRFDSHVDKLLNYIRYWQASGESIKTAIRVKTRMEQLTEAGYFTGGITPYGYRAEKCGRTNRKNQDVYDIVRDEQAAPIIQLIFHLYVHEGYGSLRISHYLAEHGITRADGRDFPNTTINRILKNKIYTGVIHNGDVESETIPELQIIDPATFQKAQQLLTARKTHRTGTPHCLNGQSLLVGNIFCGHCGNRLTLTSSGTTRLLPSGAKERVTRIRYQCHYNVRHPGRCDGQSGYGVKIVDNIVERVIMHQFSKIKAADSAAIIQQTHEANISLKKAQLKQTQKQLAAKQQEVNDYRAEVLRVIRGESSLGRDMLNGLISEAECEVKKLTGYADSLQDELTTLEHAAEAESAEYDQLQTWADLFANCNFAAKKMIVSQFIKSVHVYRDYHIEIEFNVSFDDFKSVAIDGKSLPAKART